MHSIFPDGGYFADRTFLSANLRIVLLEAKSGNVFEERFIRYYATLRNYLENASVVHKGVVLSYAKQCAQELHSSMHCLPDAFLLSSGPLAQFSPLTIPHWNISVFNVSRSLYVGALFGGVRLDRHRKQVKSARFVKMPFNMPPMLNREAEIVFERFWSETILALSPPNFVGVTAWSHGQHEEDMKLIAIRTRRLLPVLAIALVLFCTFSTMGCDRTLGKPILALCGVVSAAIGIDDMFIMMATWNRILSHNKTAPLLTLVQQTYEQCVCSMLLTSVDNVLVFTVGTLSMFPIMRIFCLYCVVSLLLVFVFQMTFFGACIALDGAKQLTLRNSLVSVPVRRISSSKNVIFAGSCAFGLLPRYSIWSVFMSGPFISLVLLSYLVYMAASLMLLNSSIELGLQLSSLVPQDSVTYAYLRVYEKYFWEYTVPMEVLIMGQLEYSAPATRHNLLHAISTIENSEYSLKASFWLSEFNEFLRTYAYLRVYEKYFWEYTVPMEVLIMGQLEYSAPATRHNLLHAISTIENSEYSLKASFWLSEFNEFLRQYTDDIAFVSLANGSLYINSTRFYVPLRKINRLTRLKAMHSLRALIDDASLRFSIRMIPMHVAFDLAEQDECLPSVLLFNTLIAGLASLLSTLILIPSVSNCALMTWATLSINAGVMALLSVSGTRLDVISTIIVLLSIGYSVDFSSHLLVHFHHSRNTSDEPLGEI
ncbi:Patched domain-containing protein 3 [Toxocara canis]|uniref:Patched domain-containing protein 3 n=1 Tax=Toxocara canis TaxID=6265 RepID=A0A0B2V9E6_TOXCA|nr:Patched domain-containing protein 3 [Toxocara canis]